MSDSSLKVSISAVDLPSLDVSEPSVATKKDDAAPDEGVSIIIRFILVSLVYSNYWVLYDSPAWLSEDFRNEFSLSNSQYGFLYVSYCISGLDSMIGGWAVSKYGAIPIGLICSILVASSTLLMLLAPNYAVLLFARFLFGAGGEVLPSVTFDIADTLFCPADRSKIFGFLFSVWRVLTFIMTNLAPRISALFSFRIALSVLFVASLFSPISVYILGTKVVPFYSAPPCSEDELDDHHPEEEEGEEDVSFFNSVEFVISEIELGTVKTTPSFDNLASLHDGAAAASKVAGFAVEADVVLPKSPSWHGYLFSFGIGLAYGHILTFVAYSTTYLEQLQYSSVAAASMLSLHPLVTCVVAPVCGVWMDRVGYRPLFLFFATLVPTISFSCLIYFRVVNSAGLTIIIIFNAGAYAVLGPASLSLLRMIFPSSQVAFVTGFLYLMINLHLIWAQTVFGMVADAHSYHDAFHLLVGLAFLSFLCMIPLLRSKFNLYRKEATFLPVSIDAIHPPSSESNN